MKKLLSFGLCLMLAVTSSLALDREHTLKVYNWADYIDEDLIAEFEQWYEEQTGEPVKIIYQLFDVNEVMLSKIEKGHEDYDVVCPSDYIIERMLKADLLLPIDRDFGSAPDYLSNVAPFMRDMIGRVDGNGKNAADYAVPYMWGTVGFLYNTEYVSREEAMDWNTLHNPRFAGRILMKEAFRDIYTSLNVARNHDAIANGEISIDDVCRDTSPESIAVIEEYLKAAKENISGYEADFGKEMMTKGKAWLNLTWSGDAQWAIEEAEDVGVSLAYEIPAAGSCVWFDAWVIPRYAKNVKAARYFINYMCKVENALRNMDVIGYVSAVGGPEILEAMSDSTAFEAIDASYFFGEEAKCVPVNPVMYPPLELVKNCGMMHDCGTEELLAMWSRVKGDNAGITAVIVLVVLVVAVVAFAVSRKKKKAVRRTHRR